MSAPPRRIVTGHDASGKSVVLSDTPTPKTLDIGTAVFHEVWTTDRSPAEIAATEPEPTDRPVRTPPPANGVMVRFTEQAPGAESPMHRTESVDVGVVLEGETWLLLDDGSETRIGRRRRRRPARDEPRVGEPVRSPREDGVRDDRRHDHRRRPRRGRAAGVLRPGPRLSASYAARWRAKPGVDSTRWSVVMHSAS